MGELSIGALYQDRYELSMALSWWRAGRAGEPAAFDYFFRSAPSGGAFAVFAGLENLLDALPRFRFSDGDLDYLAGEGFPSDFLDDLRGFRFRGRLFAAREGEPVFPEEPVLRVEGGLLECQMVETLVLNVLNFQTLVATKAARCVRAAAGREVSEFGLRRAQGPGGMWASRAAAVGGCGSTSNLAAGRRYGIPAVGTMAHSFVQSHATEREAFLAFAGVHGSDTVLLLDTYDTLRSGLPNAIRTADWLKERGGSLRGVRLDSGDLGALAKEVRRGLDEAGLEEVRIVASNQLDEWAIGELVAAGAPIDLFGVGTSLATGLPDGALDGVYKLSLAGEEARMKFSESPSKSTLPGVKTVARYRDAEGFVRADAVHLVEEPPPRTMLDPRDPGKRTDLAAWRAEPLHVLCHDAGGRTEPARATSEIAEFSRSRREGLPEECLRFEKPEAVPVGVSEELHALRESTHRKLEERHLARPGRSDQPA